MTVVIGDRLAGANAVRNARVRKTGEALNEDPTPLAPKGGLTPSQERAIESLRHGNPLHPHEVSGDLAVQEDGSVRAGVFCTQHGRHSVHITPRGKVTHHGIDTDTDREPVG
jgi:hypothetical protein